MTRPSDRSEEDVVVTPPEYDDDGLPPPAPVVTDEGVYGTLPEQRRVLREYERRERPWRDTWVRLASVVLALTGGAWLALFSGAQATSEEVALPALESLVETMTGVQNLVLLHEEAIREGDGEIPGYPLSVGVPEGALDADPSTWGNLVLTESARLVYTQGPGVFQTDPATAEGGSTFSTTAGVRRLMENLSESRHAMFSGLLWPLGLAALASAAALVALGFGFHRFQVLGWSLAVVAIPSIAAGALGWALVMFIGSDGSNLAETGHEIAQELVMIPLRNGLTVLAAGVGVAIVARIVGAFFGAPREAALEPEARY